MSTLKTTILDMKVEYLISLFEEEGEEIEEEMVVFKINLEWKIAKVENLKDCLYFEYKVLNEMNINSVTIIDKLSPIKNTLLKYLYTEIHRDLFTKLSHHYSKSL